MLTREEQGAIIKRIGELDCPSVISIPANRPFISRDAVIELLLAPQCPKRQARSRSLPT